MSIYSIMAFNSAIDRMQDNQKQSVAIDQAKQNLDEKAQQLDIMKRTKESQIKIANNQGVISDWQAKMAMDAMKDEVKPQQDQIDAFSDAAMLNQHKNQAEAAQLHGQLTTLTKDQDVQGHMSNMLAATAQVGQNPSAQLPTSGAAPTGAPPMSMPDGSVSGDKSMGAPTPQGNSIPSMIPQQPSQMPNMMQKTQQAPLNAQESAPQEPNASPSSGPAQPVAPVDNSLPQQSSEATPPHMEEDATTPQGMRPISDVMSTMDNVPFGDKRATMRDEYDINPNYYRQVAMGDKNATQFIKRVPEQVDADNPLHLSPAQEDLRQHIGVLLKNGYSRAEILKNMPEGLSAMVKSVGTYQSPESEIVSARSPNGFKIAFSGMVRELYPNYSSSNFAAKNSFMTQLASTSPNSVGGQVTSINTAAQHLGELNEKLLVSKNQNIPAGNFLVNFVQKNLGHPEVSDFNAAKEIYANEMQRLLSGKAATQSGTGREIESLSPSSSTSQLQAVIKTNANAMADRINALRDKYRNVTGEDDKGKILPPVARKILTNLIGYDKFDAYDKGDVTGSVVTPPGQGRSSSNPYEAEMRKRGLLK